MGSVVVDGGKGTFTSGDNPGGWIDTRAAGLGSFRMIFSVVDRNGDTNLLDWFVQGGTANAAGVITLDGAATALVPKSSFTQVTEATALPNIQIKSFRQGGDVAKWPRYIRANVTIGGTNSPDCTVSVEIIPDVS